MSGIDSYTKLMLHMDGTDASTTFVDSSAAPKTVTAVGTAQIDTAQSKFGGASGLFDGNSDALTIPDCDDWYFGTNPFTIDFWMAAHGYPASNDNACMIGQINESGSNYRWGILFNNNAGTKELYYYVSDGSTRYIMFAWTPTVDTWYHVAVVWDGAAFKIFINGVSQTLTSSGVPTSTYNFAFPLKIGGFINDTGRYFNGWMDEVRISKGIARWTANFTPPVSAYSVDTPAPPVGGSSKLFFGNG
jgi:hypothetical protein